MTTNNVPGLLNCPFCGGPAKRQLGGEGESRRYGCSCANWNCVGHSMMLKHMNQKAAVDEWNRRQPATPADAADTPRYRLLIDGEIIQPDDEFIDNDAVRWVPASQHPVPHIWIGMEYRLGVLKQARRRIEEQ